jgi:hypothetical protein
MGLKPWGSVRFVAPEEPLEQEEEVEVPQGPVSVKYPKRRYAPDRQWSKLRQWFIPLPNPPKVAPIDRDELRKAEKGLRLEAAEQLLEEAKVLWEARQERIHTAETKATTLLGTVAIAASLVVAGSGLILDPGRVGGTWRDVLMVVVVFLLLCLLMCGATASRALLKVHKVSRPQASHALQRAKWDDPKKGQRRRAVDLIARAGENLYIADYKLAQIRVAYRWYRLSLIFFLLLGVAIAVYVFFGALPTT